MRKGKRRIEKFDILAVAAIIVMIIVLVILGVLIYRSKDHIIELFNKKNETVVTEKEEDIPDLPYIKETKYIGGIGYPQVYEYPFEKTDIYKTNRKLWEDHPERITPICDTATEFMNRTFNFTARDIAKGTEYTDSLYELMDPYWRYDEAEREGGYSVEEHLQQWKERIVDNNISIEGEFLTDTSLVYVNSLYFVRGILEYTVYESDDKDIPVTDGKKAAMVEVQLHISNEEPDDFDVVRIEFMDTDPIPVAEK